MMQAPRSMCTIDNNAAYIDIVIYAEDDTGLAQPELSGGAFGASPQGPGEEVVGGPASRRTSSLGSRV